MEIKYLKRLSKLNVKILLFEQYLKSKDLGLLKDLIDFILFVLTTEKKRITRWSN
jgi:hypothetical protein